MPQLLPLIARFDAAAPLLWRRGALVTAGEFLGEVLALAQVLPSQPYLVNLCEQRANFLVAWCAAAVRAQDQSAARFSRSAGDRGGPGSLRRQSRRR